MLPQSKQVVDWIPTSDLAALVVPGENLPVRK